MGYPLKPLLAAAFSLCAVSLPAADILKLGSGTDLTGGANWGGDVAPSDSDIATWDSTSLASGLTLGTNVTWQGVRITGSSGSSTVSASGAGTLTLGGSGINLEGSAVSATFANAISLSADQSWRVNAGRTLTLSGALSGTGAVSIGTAATQSSSIFLTSSFQTIATGMTLSDVTGISGLLGGNWINSQRSVAAHGYQVSSSDTSQVYWLQGLDGSVKAVKLELQQSGADIQARVLAAKYQEGASPGFDFETGGTAVTVAGSYNSNGYGAFSLGLHTGAAPANQAGQVTLSGNNSGFSGNLTVNQGRLVLGLGTGFDGGSSPSRGTGTLTIGPTGVVANSVAHAIWGGHTNTRSVIVNGGVVDISVGQEYFHTLEMTAGLVTRGNGGSANLLRVGSASGAGHIATNASNVSAIIATAVDLTFNNLSLDVADGAAANDLVIAGSISQNTGAGSGARSVTKSGAGTVLLQGAGSFTGGMVVNAGTVRLGINSALGTRNTAVGTVTIADGATVDVNGIGDATYGYTLRGNGVGGIGALVNNGGLISTSTAQTTNLRLAADATIGGTGEWGMVASSYGATSVDLAGFTLTKVGSGGFHLANTTFTAGTLSIQAGAVFLNTNGAQSASGTSLLALSLGNVAGASFSLNGKSITLGSISGGGSTGGSVTLGSGTLTVGNADSTTYAGVISGTGGLIKQGSGMLTLTGSSTYSGGLTVNAGTLRLAAASQAWNTSIFGSLATVNNGGRLQVNGGNNTSSTSTITVNAGGTLEYISAYQAGGANSNYIATVNLAGASGSAAVVEGVGATRFGFNANGLINSTGAVTNTWSAGILLVNGSSRTLTVTTGSDNTLAISGVILDHTGLENTPVIKNGAGTLSLSGVNTFTGAITVSAGTLALTGAGRLGNGTYAGAIANAAILSIGTTANQTLSGVISGAGSLLKSGAGTLTLSGASANTFSGGSTLSEGTVAIGKAGALGTGVVTLAGATLQPTATVAVANNLVLQAGTTSSLIGAGAGDLMYTGAASGSGTVTLNSSASRSVWLQGDWSAFTGTINVTVNTGGTNYRLGGNPSLTQGVDATNGFDFSQAKFVLAGSGTDRGLLWNGQRGALVRIGELSGSGGRIDTGADGRHANWSIGHLGTSSSFSGLIQGAATALTKVGAGILTLGGANTFEGGVTVAGGAVRIGHMNALGAFLSGRPVSQVVVASGATVDFNGVPDATYGYTISGSGVSGLGALVNNGSAIGLGRAQASNITLSADAAIGGAGDWALLTNGYNPTALNLAGFTLTKVGANAIYLVNASVSAGAIHVGSGSLQFSPGGGGTATAPINAAGTAFSLANAAGASLGLNNLSLTLASLSGGGATGGNVALGSGTLTVGDASSTVYSGAISGTGRLVKQGAGALSLLGSSTYSGGTTVSAGTLEFGSGSLGSSGAITLAGGALRWAAGNTQDISSRLSLTGAVSLDTNGNSVILASELTGSNALTKAGQGVLTLSAANTGLSSAWTVADGTLRAGHAQAFGMGSIRVEGGILDLNGFAVTNLFTLAGGSVTGFASLSATQLDLSTTSAPKLSGVISGVLDLTDKTVDATGGLTAADILKGSNIVFDGGTVTLAEGAVHAPGSSPGVQTFAAGLAYEDNAILEWEIDLETANWTNGAPVRGENYDAINVTGGNLVIGSDVTLSLLLIQSLSAPFDDSFWNEFRSFQAISFTSPGNITGNFLVDVAEANLAAVGQGQWGFLQDAQGVALTWTPVPEPSTYGLLLGGLALAGAALRRRRRKD